MRRHIERVIQLYFLDETRDSMKGMHSSKEERWNFNYGDNATLAPYPTRFLELEKEEEAIKTFPLRTMEAEELSNEGTKTWLINLFRHQLAQGDNTLAKILVFVYGDMGTIKAIHNTQSHMADEIHDTDSLKAVIPAPGVFHLRKRILELIIKEFRGENSSDFAHLDPIIKMLNMKGFSDDKCENFRRVEDLVLLSYRSLVSASVIEFFSESLDDLYQDATATERRDFVAVKMIKMGRDRTRAEVVEYIYTTIFSPKSEYTIAREHIPNRSPPLNEQMIQASHLVQLTGLYIELKDTVRLGRVGKLPYLFRLLLPWFAGAGNGAPIYTRELAVFLIQEKCMDSNTFDSMLDNLLRPAKLGGWIEADMACEHLVRIQKDIYKAKGGSFRWEHLIKHTSLISQTLYDAKTAFSFAHLSPDKMKKKGKHHDKSQAGDVLNVTGAILKSKLLRLDDPKAVNVKNKDLWKLGIQALQTYDFEKLKSYLRGRDFSGGFEDEINESAINWDFRGAGDGDPDAIQDDDDDEDLVDAEDPAEPTFAKLLEAKRLELMATGAKLSSPSPRVSMRAETALKAKNP